MADLSGKKLLHRTYTLDQLRYRECGSFGIQARRGRHSYADRDNSDQRAISSALLGFPCLTVAMTPLTSRECCSSGNIHSITLSNAPINSAQFDVMFFDGSSVGFFVAVGRLGDKLQYLAVGHCGCYLRGVTVRHHHLSAINKTYLIVSLAELLVFLP